jgi:hypothetical protein
MPTPDNIILGDGVFYINESPIALTRGGGKFSVKRDYRQIDADGDYGPVKGRIRKTKSVATLELAALELLPADMIKLYPSLLVDHQTGHDTITAGEEILEADYQDEVVWIGETLDGRQVRITLENAINLDNIDWELKDKEEIVPKIVYTAAYLETARKTEPWSVEYLTDGYGS